MIWKEVLVLKVAGIALMVSGALSVEEKSSKISRQRQAEGVPVSENEFKQSSDKNSIQTLQKIWMLEKHFKFLTDEVKGLNRKLNSLYSRGLFITSHDIFRSQIKSNHHRRTGSTEDNGWNENVTGEEYLKRLLVSFLKENFSALKGEIVDELHHKLKKELKLQKNLKRKKRDTERSERNGFEFMNTAGGFETENVYDNDFHYSGHESALDRQLNKLTKMIETELSQYKNDNDGPAATNELPETSHSIVQSDRGFGLSIEKIFDMLRREVSNSLQQQSRNVKLTLNKHLDSVETKMTQILTLMEGMKSSYDKKFDNLLPTAITNGNDRIEQIETDIASLERSISSIRDNVIGDPNIQEQLKHIQDELLEEVSKQVEPVRRNTHELRERVQINMKQLGVTETSLQNFKADMREKVHYMELDITKLDTGLRDVNETVKSNQKKSKSCEADKEKIMTAVTFVEEIKLEWPFIWTNITNIEELSKTNLQDAKLQLNSIEADMDKLTQNQTVLRGNIRDFSISLDELSNRINKMKQVNIKLALEYDEWVEYNFQHTLEQSSCLGGKKYIKKTSYKVGKYVGVLLCSSIRYKIYLSDDIEETFLDIGDTRSFGEDHCEFVGGTRSSQITVGKSTNWFRRMEGYKRAHWGDTPVKGVLSFFTPSPPWYECDVSIP